MAQIRNAKPIVQTVRISPQAAPPPANSRLSYEFGCVAALWGVDVSQGSRPKWFEHLAGRVPCIDLDAIGIEERALSQVAQEVATAFNMIPIKLSGPGLLAAVPKHCDLPAIEISRLIGMEVRLVWADADKIRAAIRTHYGAACTPA